jgi:hypothetical protein
MALNSVTERRCASDVPDKFQSNQSPLQFLAANNQGAPCQLVKWTTH